MIDPSYERVLTVPNQVIGGFDREKALPRFPGLLMDLYGHALSAYLGCLMVALTGRSPRPEIHFGYVPKFDGPFGEVVRGWRPQDRRYGKVTIGGQTRLGVSLYTGEQGQYSAVKAWGDESQGWSNFSAPFIPYHPDHHDIPVTPTIIAEFMDRALPGVNELMEEEGALARQIRLVTQTSPRPSRGFLSPP